MDLDDLQSSNGICQLKIIHKYHIVSRLRQIVIGYGIMHLWLEEKGFILTIKGSWNLELV